MVTQNKKNNGKRLKSILILTVPAVVILVLVLGWKMRSRGSVSTNQSALYEVNRGELVISVTESGEIQARKTTDINSEVEGRTTIVSVVDEGTYITQEDVNNGKILVELDSSQLEEDINRDEIELADAKASFTDANEAYGIQLNQNESDITAAELTLKWARMDLQKYVGEKIANNLIGAIDDPGNNETEIDIVSLWEDDSMGLGGQAEQNRMELQANIEEQVAAYNRDQDKLDWTEKLYEKKFVARTELQADKMDLMRSENRTKQVDISLDLFKRYEFPKQVEKYLSDYQEAQRELERRKAQARSKEAQALARLQNAERRYNLRKDRLDKLRKQFSACIVRAKTVGLVVYATSGDRFRGRSQPVEVGSELYERQKILSIPNTTEMAVEISVHETSVDKVKPGQRAQIVVDAFPNRMFHGDVLKVAQLPDSQRGWLAPDLKVYKTQVNIEGEHLFLKPGMSAKVEIIVEELQDVVHVPIQAVSNRGGKQVCYVQAPKGLEEREVQTGSFNESSIVIKEGLEAGDLVSLNPPRIISRESNEMLAVASPQKGAAKKTDSPEGDVGTSSGAAEKPIEERGRQERPEGREEAAQAGAGGEQRGPGGFSPNPEMMKIMEKMRDPEVQKKLEAARKEGRLAEELKNQGINLPPEMLQRMESRGAGGGGRGPGGPGGGPGQGARQGGSRRGDPGQGGNRQGTRPERGNQ
jgi:HlyD family secretion protein